MLGSNGAGTSSAPATAAATSKWRGGMRAAAGSKGRVGLSLRLRNLCGCSRGCLCHDRTDDD